MTTEEKKAYLRSYRQAYFAALEAKARLAAFRERYAGVRAVMLDDMPRGGGRPRDLSDYAAQLDALETALTASITREIDRQLAVKITIGKCPNDVHRRLLSMIYIDWLSLTEVADQMGYSVRQVVRLHRQAVEDLTCP